MKGSGITVNCVLTVKKIHKRVHKQHIMVSFCALCGHLKSLQPFAIDDALLLKRVDLSVFCLCNAADGIGDAK